MLFTDYPNEFRTITTNASGRPAAAQGTSFTPGNNTKGSWAQLLTALAKPHYGILININSIAVSAAAKDALVDIGIDLAGGSSYTVFIADLLGSCASAYTIGGIWYYFPVLIPAGASLAVRGSVNNATVGTGRCYVQLFTDPTDPERIRYGTYVRSFGATGASSAGTTITSGTTAEGSWTQVGGATADELWFWQLGFGVNSATMTALAYHLDLGVGDATNKRLIATNLSVTTDTAENLTKPPRFDLYGAVPSGVNVYIRAQCSGTPNSALSVMAYGVGG